MRPTARYALILLCVSAAGLAQISLGEREYFEAPGFFFLNFHNNYMVGYQGGLQMVQNGERILDSGDLYLRMKNGPEPQHVILRRTVDRNAGSATVEGKLDGLNTGYRLSMRTDGQSIFVRLKLDGPLPPETAEAGFRIFLYPGVYLSKSFQADNGSGVFPRQYPGHSTLLSNAKALRLAQEDPLYSVALSRSDGSLSLTDNREASPQRWFAVQAPLDNGADSLEVKITPTIKPDWRRAPVIGVSQAGYHPNQKKVAILELDERETAKTPVSLYRMNVAGDMRAVKQGIAREWGRFHRFRYATFDFTDVREPGVYLLKYGAEQAGPFRIGADVLDQAWRPTLQYFLPIQMCHVQIREGARVWHGPCHLDDALQAPANKKYIDGYEQAERETPYADNQHVPGLDWGGWHDAGDHDVPAGSVARTAAALALAYEEFRPQMDETSIQRDSREVNLHLEDGRNDLLQQVEFGVEWLLGNYQAGGHILPGVIESTPRAYGHLGDMSSVSDNLVYNPQLKPLERKDGKSGKSDDRWVFTNRNTGLQYLTAQTLAIASRVLRESRPDLADRCITVAGELWDYERTQSPVYARSAYTPRDSGYRSEEISATAELYLTTGDPKYKSHLQSLGPLLNGITAEQFGRGPGWTLVRAVHRVGEPQIASIVNRLAGEWSKVAQQRTKANPYGVQYDPEVLDPGYKLESRTGIHSGFVWGHGWNLQTAAMSQYYFHKHLPQIFSADPVFATVNFVLGCHPATNESFVSGVGARSSLVAYGYNRADWAHVPGGIISGTSLIKPDYLELKTFPFLWYQTEYVIGGAATYIFDVLAAQRLAGQ